MAPDGLVGKVVSSPIFPWGGCGRARVPWALPFFCCSSLASSMGCFSSDQSSLVGEMPLFALGRLFLLSASALVEWVNIEIFLRGPPCCMVQVGVVQKLTLDPCILMMTQSLEIRSLFADAASWLKMMVL